MSSHLQGKTIIYTRYSSEMQREESCDDQEREARDGLARKCVDHRNAVILADKIISGEVADRAQFQLLCNMIQKGEVAVLAVDNQSRLTRAGASDAYSIVKDVVYHGGRFISTSEGIDTDHGGCGPPGLVLLRRPAWWPRRRATNARTDDLHPRI